jgi:DUF1680 family protein
MENNGCVALMRGPLLYCIEQADNPGIDLRNAMINGKAGTPPGSSFRPELLNGVVALQVAGLVTETAATWDDTLYRPTPPAAPPDLARNVTLTAIPYYAWANREPGPMRVWIPYHMPSLHT